MSGTQHFYAHSVLGIFYTAYYQCFMYLPVQAQHLSLFRQDEWSAEL